MFRVDVEILVSKTISISEEEDEISTTDGSLLEKNYILIEESSNRDKPLRIRLGIGVSI